MATRRQEDKEKRRQEIVAVAAELFAAQGLENVSFGDVAKKAGTSRSLVYFYFPNKESLLLAAVLETCERLHSLFHEASRGQGNGLDRIEAMGRAYLRFHLDHPAAFYLFAAHEARPDADEHSLQGRIALHKRVITQLVAQTLREGIADGSISERIPSPDILSFCLWAFVHGMAQLVAMKQETLHACDVTPKQVVDKGFTLLLRALAPR